MEVSITGQQELFNALRNFEQQAVLKDADLALRRAGMNIIQDAQRNIREKGITTTGRLISSGKVQKTHEAGGGYDVGFMEGEKNYAGAVEFGRRPGRMPPPSMMEQYAYKKLHLKDRKQSRAIGWAMAKSIAKKGTKPHPYFVPAVTKNQGTIIREISEAIQRTINRLTTNV